MPIEKNTPAPAKKTPAPNAGIEPVQVQAAPASDSTPTETPKKGRRGPRGPRGESLTWDAPRVKAMRRTARKIINSG